MREIDITKQDIRCCDEICVEDDCINIEYELWFDVDKYFGTDTKNNENVWINFYTNWNSNGEIRAEYFVSSDSSDESHNWELTDREKKFFLEKMENYCKHVTGKTLQELWNEHK